MQPNYKKKALANASIKLAFGVALIATGIIATVTSYNAAAAGGSYTIWWGPPAIGVILTIQALWQFATTERQAAKLAKFDAARKAAIQQAGTPTVQPTATATATTTSAPAVDPEDSRPIVS